MAKALALASDGSKPLKNNLHERYTRHRATALPRIVAFRKAGNTAKTDHVADANSFRLERKPGVRERIEYLARQAQDRVVEKRAALEEQLWSVLEGDIGDFFEPVEAAKVGEDGKLEANEAGKMLTVRKQRPKLLSELPPEFRKLIEDVSVDRNGNVIPKLYSKAQANRDLREMLNIGGRKEQEAEADDVSRLSDAELVRQLADTAKELGIDINLNYSFLQRNKPNEEPQG
jgi:Terminase small subunit